MVSQIGKVDLEVIKVVDVIRKVEEDGKVVDKEDKVALRFDFNMPMGASFDMVREVLKEMSEEVDKMQEDGKKRAAEADKLEGDAKKVDTEKKSVEN